MVERKKNTLELFNGLLLLLLGVSIWWYASDFPTLDEGYPGPALFPKIVAAGFLLCGLLLLITRKKGFSFTTGNFPKQPALRLAVGLALIVLFPFLINYLGFIIGLSILCFGMGLLLRVKVWKAALTAVLTSLSIYFLFVLGLGVSL